MSAGKISSRAGRTSPASNFQLLTSPLRFATQEETGIAVTHRKQRTETNPVRNKTGVFDLRFLASFPGSIFPLGVADR